ncbi:MAG: sigma-54-dependent Fis family transcriptional regulator [Candidatus Schekmanbacteria bacterium]|nr:MAG: sigma-54-dependent Fis family transcriptional regulator [Candidatus Schekmanbacteria bacterium]
MVSENILLVEDDESCRISLATILEEEGYSITTAENGRSAIKLLKEQKFSLLLTDLKLPDFDGLAVMKKAKALDSDIIVILLTAFASVESAIEAMKAGAYDYLSKPLNIDEVRLVIKKALREKNLVTENRELKKQLRGKIKFEEIVGTSEKMQGIYKMIEKVAETDSTVLIRGESGTGKELVARAIHFNSERRNYPFVTVNCSAIPKDLLESEFFGHTKGAFTGASSDRKGKFELAHRGTIFLDEIGNMDPELQVKILRALQQKEIEKIGENRKIKIDVRVISATNADLEKRVKEGLFREDLYYRLNVITIFLPPLRERKEDIPLLVNFFLKRICKEMGKEEKKVTKEALDLLCAYEWTGNVRELENAIERAVTLSDGKLITPKHLPPQVVKSDDKKKEFPLVLPDEGIDLNKVLKEMEQSLIKQALEKANGVRSKAASLLKLNRTTLLEKMRKDGLR